MSRFLLTRPASLERPFLTALCRISPVSHVLQVPLYQSAVLVGQHGRILSISGVSVHTCNIIVLTCHPFIYPQAGCCWLIVCLLPGPGLLISRQYLKQRHSQIISCILSSILLPFNTISPSDGSLCSHTGQSPHSLSRTTLLHSRNIIFEILPFLIFPFRQSSYGVRLHVPLSF